MKNKIREILKEVQDFSTDSMEKLEEFRIQYISKKGKIPALFGDFKNIPAEQRKEMGAFLNELKTKAQDKLNSLKENIAQKSHGTTSKNFDLSRPVDFRDVGTRHPLSLVRREILDILAGLGTP